VSTIFTLRVYYIFKPCLRHALAQIAACYTACNSPAFLPDDQKNLDRNFIDGEVHTQNIVENVITLFYI
jgi:hypothetical protein